MISTHVLDTTVGQPAQGVRVELERLHGAEWRPVAIEETNADGRISFSPAKEAGTYRLHFHLEAYFQRKGVDAFFTSAPVVFRIADLGRKYHVPLLLSPFAYSTYRGS